MNETVHAEVLFLYDIDYEDGMVRPKLTYEYSDEVNVYVGADVFYGNKDGLFGQFKETDRIVSGIVIGFWYENFCINRVWPHWLLDKHLEQAEIAAYLTLLNERYDAIRSSHIDVINRIENAYRFACERCDN